MTSPTLFDTLAPVRVTMRQDETLNALRLIPGPATADDVKRCLAEHGCDRERNDCAKRLSEVRDLGLAVERGKRRNAKGNNVMTFELSGSEWTR